MPIQLSLTQSPLVVGQPTLNELDLVLEHNLPHAQAEAERVGQAESAPELFWRMAFAILSVHSNFGATCGAWQELRSLEVDCHYPMASLAVLKRWPRVQYPGQKAKFLARLWDAIWQEGECFWPDGLTDCAYRGYIRESVSGLAWAKSSFAVMLVNPGGRGVDVACIDTHMYRMFTGQPARGQIRGPEYLKLEGQVRGLAQRHGVSCSVAQHALWDGNERARVMSAADELNPWEGEWVIMDPYDGGVDPNCSIPHWGIPEHRYRMEVHEHRLVDPTPYDYDYSQEPYEALFIYNRWRFPDYWLHRVARQVELKEAA